MTYKLLPIEYVYKNDNNDDAFIDESVYIGEYKKGLKEGKGTLYLKNGDKFVGNYQHGRAYGYGKYIY